MKTALYPLTFTPIFKSKIWAGDKIRTVLGKDYPMSACGETWEISAVKDNVSVVAEGVLAGRDLQSLIDEYGVSLLGKNVMEKYGTTFPLLVKFISAADDLSIQVHPDDAQAMKAHGESGKAEMWYIMDTDTDSSLISGFKEKITKEEYLQAFSGGRLLDILQRVKVRQGECFFLPPGRVHSIGRGILLLEIQQSSDITYRIYDFDRVDASTGKTRELHVEQALETMNFTDDTPAEKPYSCTENESSTMVSCPHFITDMIYATREMEINYPHEERFVIYSCVEGGCTLQSGEYEKEMKKGDCLLIPACVTNIKISPHDEGVKILSSRSV